MPINSPSTLNESSDTGLKISKNTQHLLGETYKCQVGTPEYYEAMITFWKAVQEENPNHPEPPKKIEFLEKGLNGLNGRRKEFRVLQGR